ncbi:MAG: hypothetical protein WCO42_05795 [bacterium]
MNSAIFYPSLIAILLALFLSGCSTPRGPGLDPEIKAFAEAAQSSYQRGEIERADAQYIKALQRARLTDNRGEIAINAYNLALCRMIEGNLSDARHLLLLARALSGESGVAVSRIMLAQSEAARLAGDGAASEDLARQAFAAGADREGRVQSWLLQGEAGFQAGRLQNALNCYRSAVANLTRKTPAALQARLTELAVGLVQARLMPGEVATLQMTRAGWLKQAGQFNDMVQAFVTAATAFEQASRWAEAFDCRIRAAQSLLAAGEKNPALVEVRKALELADRTGNITHKALAAGVMNDLIK